MCKAIRRTNNIGRKCVASVQVCCARWQGAINDTYALLGHGRARRCIGCNNTFPLCGECAVCVELSIAHHFNRERDAVANNLCQRLCDQGAITLINPIFCESGWNTENEGGSRLINTEECGATEPSLEGGLRKADLQLSEDCAPDLSSIHSAAPPLFRWCAPPTLRQKGGVAEESAVPPWCKFESVLAGLRQPLPQPHTERPTDGVMSFGPFVGRRRIAPAALPASPASPRF